MALATSPLKQAGMMAFMMYMAGTQLHFFSIMATFNGIYSPLNAILKSGTGKREIGHIRPLIAFGGGSEVGVGLIRSVSSLYH